MAAASGVAVGAKRPSSAVTEQEGCKRLRVGQSWDVITQITHLALEYLGVDASWRECTAVCRLLGSNVDVLPRLRDHMGKLYSDSGVKMLIETCLGSRARERIAIAGGIIPAVAHAGTKPQIDMIHSARPADDCKVAGDVDLFLFGTTDELGVWRDKLHSYIPLRWKHSSTEDEWPRQDNRQFVRDKRAIGWTRATCETYHNRVPRISWAIRLYPRGERPFANIVGICVSLPPNPISQFERRAADVADAARQLVAEFDFEFLRAFYVPSSDILEVRQVEALFTMRSVYLWNDETFSSKRVHERVTKYARRGATIINAGKTIACAEAVDAWPADERKEVVIKMKALINEGSVDTRVTAAAPDTLV